MTSTFTRGLALLLGLAGTAMVPPAAAQPVAVGAGAYVLAPKGSDKPMPAAPLRTPDMMARAAPTSQWYSTLIFNPTPFPIYVQPMSVRTTAAGLELALPGKEVRATERRDTEVAYPHKNPLLLSPVAKAPVAVQAKGRQVCTCFNVTEDAILGSVGIARTGVDVRVVDATGHDVAPGDIGEIIVRGDVVMSGYWRNPTGTAEALREGWLYTGDMGSQDKRGYITLRDRSKDVVISGGSNIYPREVEEALLTHPDVSEVSVVGQRDAEWGEIVIAFVVPRPGVTLHTEALDAHCLDRIARFKRPKRYVVLQALPKNSYGKVLKRSLREMLDDGSMTGQ